MTNSGTEWCPIPLTCGRSGRSACPCRGIPGTRAPTARARCSVALGLSVSRDGPTSIWDKHGISGNIFANPAASSSTPYPQELNPWSSHISEPVHSSPAGKNENQTPVQDQRCQSGPSAKTSFILSEGVSSKNDGADQQRLQISDLHFD